MKDNEFWARAYLLSMEHWFAVGAPGRREAADRAVGLADEMLADYHQHRAPLPKLNTSLCTDCSRPLSGECGEVGLRCWSCIEEEERCQK